MQIGGVNMKYPQLVPSWVCTTPIKLEVESEGINEDGAPSDAIIYEGFCNFQDGGQVVYTTDQKQIFISGRAYFDGDILPDISNISGGYGYIFEQKRVIHKGFKRRNPDGTVNHTEIQFK